MSELFETSKDVAWLKDLYFNDPSKVVTLEPGEELVRAGCANNRLYLILDGSLSGYLEDESGESTEVYRGTRNMFVGVYSFFSVEKLTYLTLIANEKTSVSWIGPDARDKSPEQFANHFLPVIVHELYLRQLIAEKLKQQRQAAMNRLQEKEKMAVLGQLAAGLAHELNNSVGVLHRNTEWLILSFAQYLKKSNLNHIFESSLNEGLTFDTRTLRERRKALEKEYDIPASLAKQLAKTSLPEIEIRRLLKQNAGAIETISLIAEAGFALHDMRLAAEHSTHVVHSVKELGFSNRNEEKETSLYQTISQSMALIKVMLQDVTIELVKRTDGPMYAFPGDLVQVWINLIKNACESMESAATENRTIRIELSELEKSYEVIVTDNGPGIPPPTIAKIFEPNFTTKVKGLQFGLGLGLSIVKKIVTGYKGSISVESKFGETSFKVTFPKQQRREG